MSTWTVALVLVGSSLLAGCGAPGDDGSGAADGDRPDGAALDVVVTTTILGDLVAQLVQDDASVEVVMPPGVDPHGYSPSAAQAEAMRTADLLVVSGGGVEEGMLDLIESVQAEGTPTFEALTAADPVERDEPEPGHEDDADHEDEGEAHEDEGEAHEDEGEAHEDEGDAHAHEGADPHFWHDPLRVADVVTALAERLAAVDTSLPDDAWSDRADALADRMVALDEEVEATLSVVPADRRVLVTTHEAFGYLADRYGFEVLGTVIPGGGTLAEPSASALEELATAIADSGVPAIFAEVGSPSGLADAVAQEVGDQVVVAELHADSLTDEAGAAPTYEALMRANAATIADALGAP